MRPQGVVATPRIPALAARRFGEVPERHDPSIDLLRALASAMIAVARLDAIAAAAVPHPADWRESVRQAQLEWSGLIAACADGAAVGDLVYLILEDGSAVPIDAARIDGLTIRMRRLADLGTRLCG